MFYVIDTVRVLIPRCC